MRTISWDADCACIEMVDQTALPVDFKRIHVETIPDLVESIDVLRVRGAPALGAAGAYGVALSAHRRSESDRASLLAAIESDAEVIATARPTAVNLEKGVEEALSAARAGTPPSRSGGWHLMPPRPLRTGTSSETRRLASTVRSCSAPATRS
ncbi:MAG: hypothetical protein U5K70_08910 [Halodesulfurarchaeum sp.]|nr:hypothetical protein [Halodesulfurarchaeum sp.]